MPPKGHATGLSTENIIEGSRKRIKIESESQHASPTARQISSPSLKHAGPGETLAETATSREAATQFGFKLLDVLINRLDEFDHTPLCVPFLALPSRKEYPDYYELIKRPTSLEQVRRRLQNREYTSLDECRADCEIICRNAKKYNQSGSEIWERAKVMHSLVKETYIDLVQGGNASPSLGGTLQSEPPLGEQSAALARVEKANTRARFEYLDEEGDRARVVLRLGRPGDAELDEDHEEAMPMHSTSQMEGEAVGATQGDEEEESDDANDSALVRDRSMSSKQKSSSATPAADPSVYSGPSYLTLSGKFDQRKRPGPRGKRMKSTLRHLLGDIKMKCGSRGPFLVEPFFNLPSKSEYPEYYRVIAKPISLQQIEVKATRNDYVNPHAFITELRLLLDNAQYFNEDGSTIWNDAQELRDYIEGEIVPILIADGFTLEPDDLRQSALPIDLAANSSIPAQAAAYRIQMERKAQLASGLVPPEPSMSPETPGSRPLSHRLGSQGAIAPPSPSPGPAGRDSPHSNHHGLGLTLGTASGLPSQPPSHSSSHPTTQMSLQTHTTGLRAPFPQHSNKQMPGHAANASNGTLVGASQATTFQSAPVLSPSPHRSPSNLWNGAAAGFFASPPNFRPLGAPQPEHPSTTTQELRPNSAPMVPPFMRPPLPNARSSGPKQGPVSKGLSKQSTGLSLPDPLYPLPVCGVNRPAAAPQIEVEAKTTGRKSPKFFLSNQITRQHVVTIPWDSSEVIVRFRVMKITDGSNVKDSISATEDSNRSATERIPVHRWKISTHLNSKSVPCTWCPEEGRDIQRKTMDSDEEGDGESEEIDATEGWIGLLKLPAARGTSVLEINISPPPPSSSLRKLLREAQGEETQAARALIEMPERYKVMIRRY